MSLPCLDGVGTLSTDVRRGLTKAGKRWAGATVRFASHKKNADGKWEEDMVIFVSVVGFDLGAEELAAFSKGDTVTVVGKIKALGIWKPERGEPRPSLEMFAEHVALPPPRLRKGSEAVRPAEQQGAHETSTPEQPGLFGDATEKAPGQAFSGRREEGSSDVSTPAGNVVQLHGGDSSARLLRAHRNNPYAQGGRGRPA